ncbi:TonB-dependent receptor [Piscinibacter gummiphilus]|uniref:TonB-dependent receptor n=1 Tax=Piscinibacter gummiphilus TaxID=946333 RepID=UPI0012F4CE6F|nr:TonB-dependent siderophore receptor [Piscinibacter gummiphilus]
MPVRPIPLSRPPFHLAPWALAVLLACAQPLPAAAAATTPAVPDTGTVRDYDLPAGPLATTLNRIALDAGLVLTVDARLVADRRAGAVQGRFDAAAALRQALAGTGLELRATATGGYTLQPQDPAAATPSADGATLGAVRVTASAESGGSLPPAFAGGQVARGGRVGVLGNEDLMDAPFSITSYTSELIEQQQAKSLGDLLANEASVRSDWSSRGGYSDSFTMRGFALGAGDIAFDGLYGIVPRTFTSLESVERVEVLRGLSALLSGVSPGGSLGGVINLVPKRAGDTPLARVTTSVETGGYAEAHIDVGRRFGPTGDLGLRVNAVYGDGDTAIDRQGARIRHLAAGMDYRTDGVRLSADLGSLKRTTRAPMRAASVAAGLTAVPAAPKAGTNFAEPWGSVTLESLHGAVRGEVNLNRNLTAYAAVGFRDNPTDLLVSVPTLTRTDGTFTERNLYFFDDVTSRTGEVGLRGRFDTGGVHHRVVLNASTLRQERHNLTHTVSTGTSNLYDPVFLPPPDLSAYATDPPLINRQRLSGVALADTLSLLDERVQLTLGVRQQSVKNTNYAANGTVNPPVYDRRKATPAVALAVKVRPGITLYGNYMEGLAQGPVAPVGTANAGEVFAPYVARQHEVGAKFDQHDWGATIALFQIEQPSAFSVPVAGGGLPVYRVDGEQRNRGVELNAFGEVARGTRLISGLMLLDAEQRKTAGGVNDGAHAVGAPRVQANAGIDWDVPAASGLTLSAGLVHTGRQYVTANNALSIPAWTRADFGVSYRLDVASRPLTLRARLTNAFDRDYWASASASSGQLSTGAPRTLALSASVDL